MRQLWSCPFFRPSRPPQGRFPSGPPPPAPTRRHHRRPAPLWDTPSLAPNTGGESPQGRPLSPPHARAQGRTHTAAAILAVVGPLAHLRLTVDPYALGRGDEQGEGEPVPLDHTGGVYRRRANKMTDPIPPEDLVLLPTNTILADIALRLDLQRADLATLLQHLQVSRTRAQDQGFFTPAPDPTIPEDPDR